MWPLCTIVCLFFSKKNKLIPGRMGSLYKHAPVRAGSTRRSTHIRPDLYVHSHEAPSIVSDARSTQSAGTSECEIVSWVPTGSTWSNGSADRATDRPRTFGTAQIQPPVIPLVRNTRNTEWGNHPPFVTALPCRCASRTRRNGVHVSQHCRPHKSLHWV